MDYPKITLAAARVNAGFTQKKAAKELGVCQKTLQNYESGVQVPDWDMVNKIEKLYQFPADFIFFGSILRLKRDKISI